MFGEYHQLLVLDKVPVMLSTPTNSVFQTVHILIADNDTYVAFILSIKVFIMEGVYIEIFKLFFIIYQKIEFVLLLS